LLQTVNEGTKAKIAKDFTDIVALLHGGLTPAEAVLPYIRPEIRQGLLFE
jgi:hypothetical protein